jgi:hypothetical protein
MTVCGMRGPSGYACTLDRGHGEHHIATDGSRVLDEWTNAELIAFHTAQRTPAPEIQIRRGGIWRSPYQGEIQEILGEGHQVTIRKAVPQ